MKTVKITLSIVFLLAFVGLNETFGQWAADGSNIHNTNAGYVGIGSFPAATLLHVQKNMTEPNIRVQNLGGAGGATFQMVDNASGADWKFKATNTGGFKIRDNAYALDVFTIESNSVANALYLNAAGNLGIRTSAPTANFHVAETYPSFTAAFGTNVGAYTSGTNVSIGDDNATSVIYVGQTSGYKGYLIWDYNPTPANGNFQIGTYNGSNPLVLQPVGGNVGLGTTTPASRFEIVINSDNYTRFGYTAPRPNYIYQNQNPADGDGQSGVWAYRTRSSANDGVSYDFDGSNHAIEGVSYWGDMYSFGTSGFNYNDFTRCGGVLGASYYGTFWGSLGYRSSGSINYGGYFTSYTGGGGKSNQPAMTGIGMGAWGDLFGADIHGNVYGVYAEGENYAMFTHGTTYKDNVDVNLQENGNGTNTVLYTYVSTDVCVQTSGTATLSSGKATIAFDHAFASIVSSKEPVVITVTPIGESNGVYLSDVTSAGFSVMENNAGKSNITVNYIVIGKRAGYENPQLAKEVIEKGYTDKLSRGLHPDSDIQTKGEGLYYENGELVVGIHPSLLPDPNKPQDPEMKQNENPIKSAEQNSSIENNAAGTGIKAIK
jgi:hypothetical protein